MTPLAVFLCVACLVLGLGLGIVIGRWGGL